MRSRVNEDDETLLKERYYKPAHQRAAKAIDEQGQYCYRKESHKPGHKPKRLKEVKSESESEDEPSTCSTKEEMSDNIKSPVFTRKVRPDVGISKPSVTHKVEQIYQKTLPDKDKKRKKVDKTLEMGEISPAKAADEHKLKSESKSEQGRYHNSRTSNSTISHT